MERSTRTAIVVATITGIASVVAALITAPWWSSDDRSIDAKTSERPAPSVAPSPTTYDPPPPTAPLSSSELPKYGSPSTFELDLTAGVYVDLDKRTSTLSGGSNAEFYYKGDISKGINFGRSGQLYGLSKAALISRQSAGPQACEQSTRPRKNDISEYIMKADDVICLSTSEGAWAVLDVREWGGTNGQDGKMNVTLWPVER